MRTLLVTKSAVEVLAGLAATLVPSWFFSFLLGTLDAPAGLYAFRMFGVAIIAVGIACWLARNDNGSQAGRPLILALLLYDILFVTILLAARFGAGLSGFGLWPTVLVHLALASSSVLCLRSERAVAHAE